ncbi:TIGR02678 family protein [Listeria booriae]|uniref:TIGR02678 family protein n=1 Tax=Listeria booriae TaxID=1552123 RepID=A0A7X0ZVW9_9LIST|nr:TIGR02678 family protein [Listeria booriae]MBC1503142.1 TIGR02678 family protein [Listeria booriae]MBC1511967.1 TIGR02678 family protein [Listeria booriae]MBC1530308.1 TIGR02678 family protein [Listeria booriae]MBC2258931.1 TIGR02678 family protein [Listeria booriae]MBC2311507.1 TIGR02678 family protein [Listeria booriae]
MAVKDEKLKEGLQLLFDNFWILRSESPQEYRFLRSMEKDLHRIISERFGLRIFFQTDFIKLEKIPDKSESWMGILEFEEPIDYALFCCAMAFLEEKDVKEYFLLSHICEEIAENYPGVPKVDWLNYHHRKSFIRVMKKMLDLHVIETVDGNIGRFSSQEDAEVLYVTTVYARYFMRPYLKDVHLQEQWEDLIDRERDNDENAKRHRVYKRLFMEPKLLRSDVDEGDYYYIRNQYSSIADFVSRFSPYNLEVYKNVAMLTASEGHSRGDFFPSNKALDDILLHLMAVVRKDSLSRDTLGGIHTSLQDWDRWIDHLIADYQYGWSKEYRDKSKNALSNAILTYGSEWGFFKLGTEEIIIYPTFARMAGRYKPNDIKQKKEAE